MPTQAEIALANTARAEFFKNPVAFALNAILIPGYSDINVRVNGGLGRMALVPNEGYTGKRFHGEPIPVYSVCDGRQFGFAGFAAYWCPYDNNAVKQATLWNRANAMFTDRMDGCTFAVGTASEDGAVVVAHVNQNRYERRGDTSMMEDAQRLLAVNAVGPGGKVFEPANYRRKPGESTRLESTTFGVRDPKTNKWTFYAQLVEPDGLGAYVLRTVKKVG